MSNEGYDQFIKMTKNFSNPVLPEQLIGIFTKISRENMELMEENVSRFTDQLKRLSQIKRPEELINLQKDCLSEDIKTGMENVQKIAHLSMEHIQDFTKLCGTVAHETAQERHKQQK